MSKKYVHIYLEDWQMRMVKDVLGETCATYTVEIDSGIGMLYAPPRPFTGDVHRMYLTEWQIKLVRAATGGDCEYVELVKHGAPIYLYGPAPA